MQCYPLVMIQDYDPNRRKFSKGNGSCLAASLNLVSVCNNKGWIANLIRNIPVYFHSFVLFVIVLNWKSRLKSKSFFGRVFFEWNIHIAWLVMAVNSLKEGELMLNSWIQWSSGMCKANMLLTSTLSGITRFKWM